MAESTIMSVDRFITVLTVKLCDRYYWKPFFISGVMYKIQIQKYTTCPITPKAGRDLAVYEYFQRGASAHFNNKKILFFNASLCIFFIAGEHLSPAPINPVNIWIWRRLQTELILLTYMVYQDLKSLRLRLAVTSIISCTWPLSFPFAFASIPRPFLDFLLFIVQLSPLF